MTDRLLAVVLVVLASVCGGVMLVVLAARDASDPALQAVAGLDGLSLLRAANLGRALDAVRLRMPAEARLHSFRVAPGRIDAQVVDPATGQKRDLTVGPGIDVQEDAPRDAISDTGFGPGDIDVAAPERLARAVARRTGRPLGDVDHAELLDDFSGEKWTLFLRGGRIDDRQWLADEHGAEVRRVGEPAPVHSSGGRRRR